MNIGPQVTVSGHGLDTLIAWRMGGATTYGLEGYAAVTGSAVQWLRDGAELIKDLQRPPRSRPACLTTAAFISCLP